VDAAVRLRRDTALHMAAWAARHEIVRLLLAHGANLNEKNHNG
jgi:ankyrin repeat protein